MLPSKRVNRIKNYSNKMVSLADALHCLYEFAFINGCRSIKLNLDDDAKVTFQKYFLIPGYYADKFSIFHHYSSINLYEGSSEIDNIYIYTRIQ